MFRCPRKFCERPMRAFNNVRVLLFEGSTRQVLPMMEALRMLGCFVTTVNSSILDLGFTSRYPNKKILAHWRYGDESVLLETILRELQKEQYDLVVPLTDFSARILAKNKAEIAKYARPVVNDWDVFQKASDKLETMKACEQCGIPCPKTVLLDEAQLNCQSLNLNFPVCVKPRTGYGAVGFRKVDNLTELAEIVELTKKKFGSCLIQEFIPQEGLQYKAELFIDKNGETKSACVFSKVRWYPIDGGSSTLNETVSRPDIVESCEKLLKHIRWRGYADVDLIEDPRDGIAKIMEINPRITGSVKICFESGVNFAEQILQDYLDLPVTSYLDYQVGKYMRYLHTDLLWFLKSPQRFRCRPSWFDFRNTIDQIWSWRDPLPWFAYTLQGIMKLRKDKKKRSLT